MKWRADTAQVAFELAAKRLDAKTHRVTEADRYAAHVYLQLGIRLSGQGGAS